jgi:uncharacterized membrane protein (DUF2068 family)
VTRPVGLRLIIGYKLVKALLVLGVAAFLTFDPREAARAAIAFAHELMESGALLSRAGRWVGLHVSQKDLHHAAALAWLDGTTTLAEGWLLFRGKPWGEWIVVAALAALVPFEAVSLERRPGPIKGLVMALNVAVVAYLAVRRVRERSRRRRTDAGDSGNPQA